MNDKEVDKLNKFIKRHFKCSKKKNYTKNKFILIVTNTGIGDFTAIKCDVCKDEENITDLESI